MPKIALHQRINGNKDPVLVITLTDHEAYLKDATTSDSVEYVVQLIERWLKRKLNVT